MDESGSEPWSERRREEEKDGIGQQERIRGV
jgi:hypothetical protein